MAITLTGTGGLFTRLGALIYSVKDTVNVYQGTTLTARATAIQSQYLSTDSNLIDQLYSNLSQAQNGARNFATYCSTLAQKTIVSQVNDAYPQNNQSFQTAIAFLLNYLVANSETVVRNTVTGTVTPGGTNTGDGVARVSVINNQGLPVEQCFSETITGTVTTDSRSGKTTAGLESLSLSGQFPITDPLSWLWPAGSGVTSSAVAVAPVSSNGNGTRNWLNNGSFETFVATANVPDNWHIDTGSAGSTIMESSTHYDGAKSVEFVGNSSENTAIKTRFGTDFSAPAQPIDQLCVNLWLKVDVVPAGGVLTVELVDGSGTTLQDTQGADSKFTVTLSSATTSWVAHGGFLRTPALLPAQVWLRLRLSTALSTGSSLFMDRISMARPTVPYLGGPSLIIFSGVTPFQAGDNFAFAIANSRDGLIQSGCDQLLGLRNLGIIFPSTTGTATILDSLVA